MGFKEWLVPQDRAFFERLDALAQNGQAAARAYAGLVGDWSSRAEHAKTLLDIEHEADGVAHALFEVLNRTFITPIEREDIARLTHALDDVVDAIHAAAERTLVCKVPKPTPHMTAFAELLVRQTAEVAKGVAALRRRNSYGRDLPPIAVEVHRLENEADRTLHAALEDLYAQKDPMAVVRHLAVYELLEQATDRCEDVADVLQDVVRKHA